MNKKAKVCPPIKTFNLICRACLRQSDKLYPVKGITFSDPPNSKVTTINMSSVFEKYCSVKIHDMDRKPQNLCHKCLEIAYTAYHFFEMFRYSNQLLTKALRIGLNHYENQLNPKSCNDMASRPRNDHTFNIKNIQTLENCENQDINKINTADKPENVMENVDTNILSVKAKSPNVFLLECNSNMLGKGSPSVPMNQKVEYKKSSSKQKAYFQFVRDWDTHKQGDKATVSNNLSVEKLAEKSLSVDDRDTSNTYNNKPDIQQKEADSGAIKSKQTEIKSEEASPLASLFKSIETMPEQEFFLLEIVPKTELDAIIDLTKEDEKNKLPSSSIIMNKCQNLKPGKRECSNKNNVREQPNAVKGDVREDKHTTLKNNEVNTTEKNKLPSNSIIMNQCQYLKPGKRECFNVNNVREQPNTVKGDVKEDKHTTLKNNEVIANKRDLQKSVNGKNSNIKDIVRHDHNYSDVSTLICNIKIIHRPNIFCRFCFVVLKNMEQAIKHINLRHSKLMKCIICHKGLCKTRKRLIFHTAQHFKNSLFCQKCHLYFSDQDLLNKHNEAFWEIHTNPKVCPICKKISRSRSANEQHMRVHDNKKMQVFDKEKNATVRTVLCHICGKSFAFFSNLQQHLKSFHQEINLVYHLCYICGKTFQSNSSLCHHIKVCHKNEDEKNIFSCKFCSLKFIDQETYQKHLNAIHEKKYVCHVCAKAFFFNKTLANHMQCHEEKTYSECNRCHKKILKKNIKHHLTKHCNGEVQVSRTHSCKVCHRIFNNKCLLKNHIKHHEGSYKCPYCSVCFASRRLRTFHCQRQHPEFAEEFLVKRRKHTYRLKRLRLLKAKKNQLKESLKQESQ